MSHPIVFDPLAISLAAGSQQVLVRNNPHERLETWDFVPSPNRENSRQSSDDDFTIIAPREGGVTPRAPGELHQMTPWSWRMWGSSQWVCLNSCLWLLFLLNRSLYGDLFFMSIFFRLAWFALQCVLQEKQCCLFDMTIASPITMCLGNKNFQF